MMIKSEKIGFAGGRPGMVEAGRPDIVPDVSDGFEMILEVDDDDGKVFTWIKTRMGDEANPLIFVEGFENVERIVATLVRVASEPPVAIETHHPGQVAIGNGALCAYYSHARVRSEIEGDDEVEEGPVNTAGVLIHKVDDVVRLTAYAPGPDRHSRNQIGKTIVALSGPMDRTVADRIVFEFDRIRSIAHDVIEEIEMRPAPTAPAVAAPAP